MSEIIDISKLTKILQNNGDQVLNASSKLSLNAILLQKINNEFELFFENGNEKENNSFQVLANSSGSQLLQDLQFLHDFFQKTVGLKLTNNTSLPLMNKKIDLSKFKYIKYLEIKKVPIKEIVGLKVIQSRLESLVCMRCLSKLEELLTECGGDDSNGSVWGELREVVITYNNIKTVDTSIALAPWLEVLDLSHNQLYDVKALECLPNLKYINLSFNNLNVIPIFNKSARKKMQVLVMKNNYVEDLSGLTGLDYLTEIDMSWNWVSNYSSLHPFLSMSALQSITLEGNPIYYHKDYRKNIVHYLHISASFSGFVIDGKKLSKHERSVVGFKLCEPCRSSNSSPVESASSISVQSPSNEYKNNGKKSGKVILAVIPNLDDGTFEEMPSDLRTFSFKDSGSAEHLITKRRIEDVRATYGSDNWLRCEAGSVVQDILSLPQTEVVSSTPLDEYCLEAALSSKNNIITTEAIVEKRPVTPEIKHNEKNSDSFGSCNDEYSSNYVSIENQHSDVEIVSNKNQDSVQWKETSPDIEAIQDSSDEIEDENEKLYLVARITKLPNNEFQEEELFLSLTDSELKEKDSNHGQVINKWSIISLESCVKLQSGRLCLNFDTIKRDKRERIYEMEETEAHSLYKILSQILESRPLHDMNQIVYKCVSCSSQFSKELRPRKQEENSKCPVCNSSIILEVDDYDSTSDATMENMKPNTSDKIFSLDSHVKVPSGTAPSTDNQNVDHIMECSSQSSIGSAASVDDFNELPPFRNTNLKQSDSDIEILSNPSQSSIEVIDGSTRIYNGATPRRKGSSEESQTVQTLQTSTGHSTAIAGLTESSSSGSVTDSVCTAYESSSAMQTVSTRLNNTELEKVGEKQSKMRGERKLETNVHSNKDKLKESYRSDRKLGRDVLHSIEYSYTNFRVIDHRIKLFLYSRIFEDNDEEFDFLLRCTVLLDYSTASFQSCIVSSNKYLYILKVVGLEEGDDASNFLQKLNTLRFKLKVIKNFQLLAWHQGFSVKFKEPQYRLSEFLILLKDVKRTTCFLDFLQSSGSQIGIYCKIFPECSEKPYLAIQQMLISDVSDDTSIQYFSIFCYCKVIHHPDAQEIIAGAILTNSTDLLLFISEPTWLFDGSSQPPEAGFNKKLRSLMSVEAKNRVTFLQFLNESEEKEEIWELCMETPDAVEELVTSLRSSWEKMFSVPLQVSLL